MWCSMHRDVYLWRRAGVRVPFRGYLRHQAGASWTFMGRRMMFGLYPFPSCSRVEMSFSVLQRRTIDCAIWYGSISSPKKN
ncbi:hypothetical protein L21_1020 [Methanoculleus chikugoensis]|uniref:Uncharacterized protein n=1 Tax=Methanoculleus chikugoensis TaxID=118126 RepID=A0A1M4MJM7_9EURY|nr:hypothetical protein L21_1020 [Methanoculleus chikugoensis]